MELVNMEKRHTDAYIGSVYNPLSMESLTEIAKVKNSIKGLNANLKREGVKDGFGKPLRYRVTLKYREPKEGGYNHFGDITGGIKNAKRVDIYIHQRRVY